MTKQELLQRTKAYALLVESDSLPLRRLTALMQEGDEILSIIVAAIRTTRAQRTAKVVIPKS
jgi:hypothetical protein